MIGVEILRALCALVGAAAAGLLPLHAHAAGAYSVDDSEIDRPGACKVESWVSSATNHDFSAIAAPACVVSLGVPVEIGGQLQRSRKGDQWSSGATAKGKANILPAGTGKVGIGIAGSAGWDLGTGAFTGHTLYVPVTFQLRDDVRVNLNGGWQYDAVARVSYAYWGAGFEWNFMKPLTLIGEVYGFSGPSQEVRSLTDPRAQLGLRITPVEAIDLDLIYGHNIGGENAHWLTLGVNLRF